MAEKEHIDEPNGRDRGEFDWTRFGNIVKHHRTQTLTKLETLQDLTGVPVSIISNIEKGRPASVDNLLAICCYLKINPNKLFSKYVKPATQTQVIPPEKAQPEPETKQVSPLTLLEPDTP